MIFCTILNSTRQNKKESHYHNSTETLTTEELIPSKRIQISICHSADTTQTGTNKSVIRKITFLPNIQHPFILNFIQPKNLLVHDTTRFYSSYLVWPGHQPFLFWKTEWACSYILEVTIIDKISTIVTQLNYC